MDDTFKAKTLDQGYQRKAFYGMGNRKLSFIQINSELFLQGAALNSVSRSFRALLKSVLNSLGCLYCSYGKPDRATRCPT